MPYLFDTEVDAAVAQDADRYRNVQEYCISNTQRLLNTPALVNPNYPYPDLQASIRVDDMGTKSSRERVPEKKNDPHASWEAYLGSAWQLASKNQKELHDMVSAELKHAHDLGLDIRSAEVVGTMYKIAGLIFSEIRPYRSPTQKDEKR